MAFIRLPFRPSILGAIALLLAAAVFVLYSVVGNLVGDWGIEYMTPIFQVVSTLALFFLAISCLTGYGSEIHIILTYPYVRQVPKRPNTRSKLEYQLRLRQELVAAANTAITEARRRLTGFLEQIVMPHSIEKPFSITSGMGGNAKHFDALGLRIKDALYDFPQLFRGRMGQDLGISHVVDDPNWETASVPYEDRVDPLGISLSYYRLWYCRHDALIVVMENARDLLNREIASICTVLNFVDIKTET